MKSAVVFATVTRNGKTIAGCSRLVRYEKRTAEVIGQVVNLINEEMTNRNDFVRIDSWLEVEDD
jgi:hypothetical protein